MKLYTVWRSCQGYDEYDEFVVWAETEQQARQVAANASAGEGPAVWLNEKKSNCAELTDDGEPGVVVGSFNAG